MRLAEYRALFLPAIYSATSFFNAHARGMFWGPRSKVARLKPRRARVRGRGNAKAKEREREGFLHRNFMVETRTAILVGNRSAAAVAATVGLPPLSRSLLFVENSLSLARRPLLRDELSAQIFYN